MVYNPADSHGKGTIIIKKLYCTVQLSCYITLFQKYLYNMTYNFEYMTIYLLIYTLWNLRLMKMILDLSKGVENQVILNFCLYLPIYSFN